MKEATLSAQYTTEEVYQRTPHRPNWVGLIFSFVCLGTLIWGWYSFGSFDTAFRRAFPLFFLTPSPALPDASQNFRVVDGIRWVHLVATDSSGRGYKGWVSEFAFYKSPPHISSDTNTLFRILGFPTLSESMTNLRNLRTLQEGLKKQLNQ